MKESFGPNGQREVVLVIHMDDKLSELGIVDTQYHKHISDNLAYLNNLAGQGVLDFNRIEVVSKKQIN